MTILSDSDIKNLLDKEIVIQPFDENSLTPIGYDLRVGEFVFSLDRGLLRHSNGLYFIPPKNTVQILTMESLWVSNKIAGTFHSMVSIASKGLSHISTTLDPGWYGPLLITLRNNTNSKIALEVGSSFVTLIFYRLSKPVQKTNRDFSFIERILLEQLQGQTALVHKSRSRRNVSVNSTTVRPSASGS
jgi:deoxycytidine triphosphate deaminase